MSNTWRAAPHAEEWAVVRPARGGLELYRLPKDLTVLTFQHRRAADIWASVLNDADDTRRRASQERA